MIYLDKETPSCGIKVIRHAEVKAKLGVSGAKLFDMVAKGQFPRPFSIVPGGRAKGWVESTVDDWIKGRELGESWEEST
jgi:prophage regulatory protein